MVPRSLRPRLIPAIVISGLYIRNGRYYAQLWVDLGGGRKCPKRFPLFDEDNQPIRNLSGAREALEIKRHERRERTLPNAREEAPIQRLL